MAEPNISIKNGAYMTHTDYPPPSGMEKHFKYLWPIVVMCVTILLNIIIHLISNGWLSGVAKDVELQQVKAQVVELKSNTTEIGKGVNDLNEKFSGLAGFITAKLATPIPASPIPRKVALRKPPQKKALF